MQNHKKVLLVGNPNVGKSSLFNILCNKNQKIANYTGVTVSSHSGTYSYRGQEVEVIDLPGSYSIYPNSEDEYVLTKHIDEVENYFGVVYVLEALSIKRGLLLLQQIQDLGLPVLLVVNQIDEAVKRGVDIDLEILSKSLGVSVLATNAKQNKGIEALRDAIFNNDFKVSETLCFEIPSEYRDHVEGDRDKYKDWTLLVSGKKKVRNEKGHFLVGERLKTQEFIRRYQKIDAIILNAVTKKQEGRELLTEKLDKILVHRVFGYLIFGMLLLLIFHCVFFLAEYPMTWIEDAFAMLSEYTESVLPEGPIADLISKGVIPGISGVMVFAPQIFILLYFLYILEDSGYMARVVFLMDRILRPFGLNGKSIVPLVSGTACAVPAIMAARNIENTKERMLTILVTPFITCSARLPIYSIIIALIIPDEYFGGISYKALALLVMYFLGFLVAIVSSWILKNLIKPQEKSYLIMDLPTYKMPLWVNDFKLVMGKVWEFVTSAGKIIFAVSIILWALAYFGPRQNRDEIVATNVELEQSYLAIVGGVIEPIVEPLGYDWKMGIGVVTSFAAREVFVGTVAVLYGLDEDIDAESEEGERTMLDKMRHDVKPNGDKVFTFATGLSILMFYAFSMQCISTIAIVYRETKSLKWTLGQLVAMSSFAYFVAFAIYQIFK